METKLILRLDGQFFTELLSQAATKTVTIKKKGANILVVKRVHDSSEEKITIEILD